MQKVTILKQDHFGRGITKVDDKLIFVEKALPQEECVIDIYQNKKKYSLAKITDLIKVSSNRIMPSCPYYDICGGCHIMHENLTEQLAFKRQKVKEILEKFAKVKDIKISDIVHVNSFNYRNKIILHGQKGKLGFYKEQTHEIVPIAECLITKNEINEIYNQVQNYLLANKDEEIDKLMIRTTSTNEKMIALTGNVNIDKFISSFNNVNSIYINSNLVLGKKFITEEVFNLKFKVYPDSFFQVNYDMMIELYKKIQTFYKDKNYANVLDLYCGTGTIGMIISNYVENIVGVEVIESSIKSALECKKENNINNISFKCGKVEELIDEFDSVDSIIVDPPRKGLDKHSINTILKLNPKSIIYVSCDPVTMARDLKALSDKYNIIE